MTIEYYWGSTLLINRPWFINPGLALNNHSIYHDIVEMTH